MLFSFYKRLLKYHCDCEAKPKQEAISTGLRSLFRAKQRNLIFRGCEFASASPRNRYAPRPVRKVPLISLKFSNGARNDTSEISPVD